MKKTILILVLTLFLVSCSAAQDISDEDMATRVAQILTEEMPTATIGIEYPTNTPESAEDTGEVEEEINEPVVISATPTETELPPTATNTLVPTETPTLEPTATNTAAPTNTPPATDPRTNLGAPISTDPMDNANTWHWPVGDQDFTAAEFEDGYLVMVGLQDVAGWRLPMTPAATDMYVEMTVKNGTCTGEDNYGIIFRIPVFNEADRGYLFSVSCDGRYRLLKWDGKEGENGTSTWLVAWKSSPYINTGTDAVNRIGVMTHDDHFYFYANGFRLNETFIVQDLDDPYPGGHFGVFVSSKVTDDFTIYIDEMSYWLTSYQP